MKRPPTGVVGAVAGLLTGLAVLGWRLVLPVPPVPVDGAMGRVVAEISARPRVDEAWVVWSDAAGEGSVGSVPREVPLGSVRKWTTAAVIGTLVDEGTLDLDAPVGDHLPSWEGRQGVTLRRLLSHTAGLPMRPPPGACSGAGSLGACIDRVADTPGLAPPGARFGYSSLGFQVAARVAERAAGAPWEQLFAERLAAPLELTDWRFEAAGPGLPDMEGMLWMAPRDLLAFVRAATTGEGPHGRWLSEAMTAELVRGQTGGVPKMGPIPRGDWWLPGDDPHGLGVWRAGALDDGPRFVFSEGKQRVVAWFDRATDRAVVFGIPYDGRVALAERVLPHDVIHAVCTATDPGPDADVRCLPFAGSADQVEVYRICRSGRGEHRICLAAAQRAGAP